MLWIILGLLASYLIGSIPTAYIVGRLLKGIDIRKYGSGNIGATNALRVLGKPIGISVLFIDMLKGIIPVVALLGLGIFIIVVLITRFVSLGSMIASISIIIWTFLLDSGSAALLATLIGFMVIIRHKTNIIRLFKGTENKIFQKSVEG